MNNALHGKQRVASRIAISSSGKTAQARKAAGHACLAVLMQKPLEIPLLLEAMRELPAEPATERLSRIAGHGPQTRYLG